MSAGHVVRVTSRRAPSIAWSCARCRSKVFECSERFRANSNGKLVDIWLIYRCRQCAATKNVTIVERGPVSRVSRELLLAAETNDALFARQCARDVGLLRCNGIAIAEGDDWDVDCLGALPLSLVFPEPLLVRLDRVLAAALGVPRSRLPIEVDGRLRLHASADLRAGA